MSVSRKALAEAVIRLLETAKNRQEAARSVASYLVAERRTKELNSLLRELEELRYKDAGVLEVTAESAHRLSDETKRRIKQLFADDARKVDIHEVINNEVLGGVKVRALDKVADFSVQARLRRLRQGVK